MRFRVFYRTWCRLAAIMPILLINVFGMPKTSADGGIPLYVRISFIAGGICFLAAVLDTVLSTKEYPPEYFDEEQGSSQGYLKGLATAFRHMPRSFVRLAPVQFAAWFGLFSDVVLSDNNDNRTCFGAQIRIVSSMQMGWPGPICVIFGYYSVVTFLFALFMPRLAVMMGNVRLHALCLLAGGIGIA